MLEEKLPPEASPLATFGCRDGHSVMVLGERTDGTIVHISDVPSGEACECTCPGCGSTLVARKGARNEHHFGHKGKPVGTACRTGPETALHKFAKQVLDRRLVLTLPPLQLVEEGDVWTKFDGGPYRFDEAVMERRIDVIVPDVMARKGSRDLLVEFIVTHACGPEKLARIRELGIGAIEIDLSDLPRDIGSVGLEEAILDRAPRSWLYNSLELEDRAELARRRQRRAVAQAAKAKRLAAFYEKSARAVRTARPNSREHANMIADGCGESLGLAVGGLGAFVVPPGDWQAACLSELVQSSKPVAAPVLLRTLRSKGWTRDPFAYMAKEDVGAVRKLNPSFATAYEAVLAWASEACRLEVLMSVGRASWVVTTATREMVRKGWYRRNLPRQRREDVRELVAELLDTLPGTERAAFVFDEWFSTPLPGRNYAIAEILDVENHRFGSVETELAHLASRIRSCPKPGLDLLGLPLGGLLERSLARAEAAELLERQRRLAEERRKAEEKAGRLLREAEDRVRELRASAARELDDRTERWMSTIEPSLGRTPEEAARAGRAELRRAIETAKEIHRKEVQVSLAEEEAKIARADLRTEAAKRFQGERLELFLRSPDPRLGGISPWAFCTNRAMFERCRERVLPPGRSARRSSS